MCSARTFERLMGFVDFEVYSVDGCQSLETDPVKIAIPVCLAEDAGAEEIQTYGLLTESVQAAKKNQVAQAVAEYAEFVQQFEGPGAQAQELPAAERLKQLEAKEEDVDHLLYRLKNEDQTAGQLTEADEALLEESKAKANKLKRTLAMEIRFGKK